MSVVTNFTELQMFVKNIEEFDINSESIALEISKRLRNIVLAEVNRGQFTGGVWKDKPYSENRIKAYKLGTVEIVGSGRERDMYINGIIIDRNDWYWGGIDKETGAVKTASGMIYDDFLINPAPFGGGGDFNGRNPGRPSPVFIPGYRGWRLMYNGLGSTVDLDFTGTMIGDFNVSVQKLKGSNRYGGKYEYTFEVTDDFDDVGRITDFYRNWMSVNDDEIQRAIDEFEARIISLF